MAIPKKYKATRGTPIPIILTMSAGVKIIEIKAIARTAIRHWLR
jgi:hypothetical protein